MRGGEGQGEGARTREVGSKAWPFRLALKSQSMGGQGSAAVPVRDRRGEPRDEFNIGFE